MKRTSDWIGFLGSLIAVCCLASCEGDQPGSAYEWSELPPLPPIPVGGGSVTLEVDAGDLPPVILAPIAGGGHGDVQPGLAGPVVGSSNGALIVAGGANFPEAMPWDGGAKKWHEQVYVLSDADADAWITRKGWWLPRPVAYGVSISTEEGVICIGGCDAEKCHAEIYRLEWDPAEEKFFTVELAAMPVPLAFMAGAKIGNTVFVIGGQRTMQDAAATTDFLAYDIAADSWTELPPFPGLPRVLPLVAAQSDGSEECLYVISGRDVQPGQTTKLLSDTWKYALSTKTWTELAPVSADEGKTERCVMAGTCVATVEDRITVFGGADGKLLLELERLGKLSTGEGDEAKAAAAKSREILTDHPGFSRDILSYDTVADRWTMIGELPFGSQVTTTALPWRGGVVIPSGEIQPGVRTPKVWFGQ